jgi:WD40 repeat protein
MDWNGARGEILAIASARAFIWDSQTGALVHLIEPYTTPIEAAEWSPDGNRLAVGDTTGYFFIENLATGAAGGYHISDAMDFFGVLSIAWSPDSKEVAVAGGPGYIVFFGMTAYDLSIGRIGRGNIFITPGTYDPTNFVYPDNIGAIDWHPTQNLIAAGRWNGTLEIWDIETETIISTVLLDAPVLSLAWSPDGAQLAYNAGANLALMPSPIVSPPTPTATPTPTPTPTAQPPPPACATDLRAVAAALGK